MGTTSPDNLRYPDGPVLVGRLQSWFKNLADDVQLAVNSLTNQHIEFVTSKAFPNGAVWESVGVFAVDAAKTTNTQMATVGNGFVTLKAPGVYAVSTESKATTSATGTNYLTDIRLGSNAEAARLIGGNGATPSLSASYLALANVRVTAPDTLLYCNLFAAADVVGKTFDTRLRITKLGRV